MSSRLKEIGWEPLTWDMAPEDIQRDAEAELYDANALRAWVVSEYSRQTKEANPKRPDRGKFNKWWRYQMEEGEVFHRKFPRLQSLLYLSLSQKIDWLSQRHCHLCETSKAAADQVIYVTPVRLAPESRQVLDSINWTAFQQAIASWFKTRDVKIEAEYLCIALTFVLSSQRKDRDLDNLTKAFMDAYSRALGFNDASVHHLDLIKVIATTEEEYCYVRLAPSLIGDLEDVVFPTIDHEWAVGNALSLVDFATS